jgi:hypothetical protein
VSQGLTDEQIKQEQAFMKGLPRVNWAAFLLPPIWGPANGFWVTILFYPAWLICDNVIYGAYVAPSWFSILFAVLAVIIMFAVTLAFAIIGQPIAAHRADEKGISRKDYLKRQRVWAIGCLIGGIILIALATYYNLAIRPTIA